MTRIKVHIFSVKLPFYPLCVVKCGLQNRVSTEYRLVDINMVVIRHALEFWGAHKLSIDFPLYSRDDQEWFSAEFRVWRDMRDPVFVLDLSLLVSTDIPLPTDILRDYTLEFEIRVEKAFTDLRECLREVIKDRDCYRKLANTFMEDIEEMSSVQEHELAALPSELDRRGPAPPSTKAKCV